MRKVIYSVLVLGLISCQSKPAETATEPAEAPVEKTITEEEDDQVEPFGQIFRSDGAHPGIASEWIQVGFPFDENSSTLEGIWYWDTKNETKQAVKIVEQTFNAGELSAYSGKIKFKGNPTLYSFSIIEDRFNLIDEETDSQQEFTYDYDAN